MGEVRRLLLIPIPGGEVRHLSPKEGADLFGIALHLQLLPPEDYDTYFKAEDRYEAAVTALCRQVAAGEVPTGGREAGALLRQIVSEQAYKDIYYPMGRALFDQRE